MATARSRDTARELAESSMVSLESKIPTDKSSFLSDTTPVVVWSLVVEWSISLLSNSVVLVGLFIVVEVVVNELSSMVSM